jgi:cell division septation protein DedD
MRRSVWVAGVVLVVMWAWALRTPTASLVQLKLALDRHDLAAVERRVDRHALASEALVGLVDEADATSQPIRVAIGGDAGWLPAIPSARAWLRLQVDRTIERLVEDPASRLTVSWEQLEDTLDTLERSGATAFFRFTDADGADYAVRMRQGWWHWRIVSIERDGRPLLLAPATPRPEQTAAVAEHLDDVPVNGIVTEPPADLPLDEPVAEVEPPEPVEPAAAEPAPLPRLAPMVAAVAESPAPEPGPDARAHWTPGGRPFVRRLDGASWTVQVGSSTDALAAAVQRDRFASRGEAAIVQAVTVRGTQWHRVLVGSFPTKREADQVASRLGAGTAN